MSQDEESFLSRWSRRKHEARREEAAEPAPAAEVPVEAPETYAAEDAQAGTTLPASASVAPAELPPELPPLDSLDGLRSDYQAFLDKAVDEDTRRSALKKLFGDPHFNQMDGLDVYVDDYTQFEPMPAAMRLTLRHAREFLLDSERLAMGLGPTHGPEGMNTAPAAPSLAGAAPDQPACVADTTADPTTEDALAATAQGVDATPLPAADGTADTAPLAAEAHSQGSTATAGSASAQQLAAPALEPATRSAAPPPATV